jgi:hypothetical protein
MSSRMDFSVGTEGKYVIVRVGDLTGEVPFDIKATRDTKLTVMLKPH